MSNTKQNWSPFWDIQGFFTINGKVVDGVWIAPELAKTDAQFSEIFARELARTGIEDPAFNRSETVKRLFDRMARFQECLALEFPGIKDGDPAYIEMRGVIELFSLYIKTLPGKTQVTPIIPAAPTYLWGLTEAEIEKILETILPADRENARLLFSQQKPKGKICLSKADFIYAVGRLIRNRVIPISKEDAIDFFNAHFSKNDGSDYSKSTIGKYLSTANVNLGGSVFVFLSRKK